MTAPRTVQRAGSARARRQLHLGPIKAAPLCSAPTLSGTVESLRASTDPLLYFVEQLCLRSGPESRRNHRARLLAALVGGAVVVEDAFCGGRFGRALDACPLQRRSPAVGIARRARHSGGYYVGGPAVVVEGNLQRLGSSSVHRVEVAVVRRHEHRRPVRAHRRARVHAVAGGGVPLLGSSHGVHRVEAAVHRPHEHH